MKHLRVLYHLMRADFIERVRSYGFLMTLLFTIFLTYFFIPALDAPFYAILVLGGDESVYNYRPIYNSAWIGSMTTLLMGEFFLLFAFYLLKGTVERDRRTGVGQIIATTPISKPAYVLGKWLSNLAVIVTMVAIIIVAAGALQLVRGEELQLDAWALASPFVIVLLPALAVIAAVTILFESINALRGGLGNVLFFFVAYPVLILSLDLNGSGVLYPSIYQACAARFPNCNSSRQIDLDSVSLAGMPTFRYEGIDWTLDLVGGRASLVLVGAAIALAAAFFFHRFDPAKADKTLLGDLPGRLKQAILSFVTAPAEAVESSNTPSGGSSLRAAPATLPQFGSRTRAFRLSGEMHPMSRAILQPSRPALYMQLLMAEMRLVFKGVSSLWYVGAVGLVGAGFLVPLDLAHMAVLPLAWLWPLTVWSSMGTREVRHQTEQIVFSTPYPFQRQLLVTWLVGMLIALAMSSGIVARMGLAGQWSPLVAVCIGALFVPTLALAMGCWSDGSKLFEAFYLFVWYMASVHGVPHLDFMGRVPGARYWGVPWVYAGLTILLIGAAVAGRRRQIKP